ncbi:MAG: prolyl oligopeptidase family serine peptidase [Bacilli bacterium]|nr:prolyl oligopeptidase family serine peptidase [Bacilli bacterium]
MKTGFIILIIIGILLLLLFIFLLYIYNLIFLMTKRRKMKGLSFDVPFGSDSDKDIVRNNTKILKEYPHKDVYIKSYDGLTLHGYYYHINDDSPLEIAFHGYKGQAFRDFSGGALMMIERGFNLLLVEERAHGYSGGHTITFGVKERYDVLSWVNFANKNLIKNNKNIILGGISMGAATVVMASSLELENVRGIIADCPYSSPKEIILNTVKNMKLNEKLAYPFIYLSALLFGRFRLNKSSAVKEIENSKYKVLLIHGMSDSFVPFKMSEEIASKSSLVEFHAFSGADHGLSYIVDSNRYIKIVNDFLDNVLTN